MALGVRSEDDLVDPQTLKLMLKVRVFLETPGESKISTLMYSEVSQSGLTLCNPMDCSLPGSSVHGILQARILEWVAISFSRGSSQPSDRTQVSCTAGRRFSV